MKYLFAILIATAMAKPASAKAIRIDFSNLQSFAIGEGFDCGNRLAQFGFLTLIELKDGSNLTAKTCLECPISFRKTRTSQLNNLSRISHNDTSFEKNNARIVCFKTVANFDAESNALSFDQKLSACE